MNYFVVNGKVVRVERIESAARKIPTTARPALKLYRGKNEGQLVKKVEKTK